MTNVNPEKYREDMETLYREKNGVREDYVAGNNLLNDLLYVKDGKKEFIVGRRSRIKQYEADSMRLDPRTVVESTIFAVPLVNNKLSSEPLQIRSSSSSKYRYIYEFFDAEVKCVETRMSKEKSKVHVTVGDASHPNFSFYAGDDKYRDVTDPRQVAEILVHNHSQDKSISTIMEMCGRFLGGKETISKALKVEKEREKRVQRFRKLRQMVRDKRTKLAVKKAYEAEKKAREDAANLKKKSIDNFLR